MNEHVRHARYVRGIPLPDVSAEISAVEPIERQSASAIGLSGVAGFRHRRVRCTNTDAMFVTLEVTHAEMSPLKLTALKNLPGRGSEATISLERLAQAVHAHIAHVRHARCVPR